MSLTLTNTTGSPISLATLGGMILPAVTTVDISARVTEEEFAQIYEREIKALVLVGDVIVDDGSSPITVAEQDAVGNLFTKREHDLAGGGGGAAILEDEFIPTSAQTIFTLSTPAASGGYVLLTVNGVEADQTIQYTVVGTTLTWLDVPYSLDTSDKLIIKYEI